MRLDPIESEHTQLGYGLTESTTLDWVVTESSSSLFFFSL
jgi:hypothetical protein